MSKRVDIRGEVHNSLLVLRFIKNQNSHAQWKCKCLKCKKPVFVTYSNIVSGNTKSCSSCGQKVLSASKDKEISKLYSKKEYSLQKIADLYNVCRSTIRNSLLRTKTPIRSQGR